VPPLWRGGSGLVGNGNTPNMIPLLSEGFPTPTPEVRLGDSIGSPEPAQRGLAGRPLTTSEG
jgi:hypothetical protein